MDPNLFFSRTVKPWLLGISRVSHYGLNSSIVVFNAYLSVQVDLITMWGGEAEGSIKLFLFIVAVRELNPVCMLEVHSVSKMSPA